MANVCDFVGHRQYSAHVYCTAKMVASLKVMDTILEASCSANLLSDNVLHVFIAHPTYFLGHGHFCIVVIALNYL